MRVRVSGVTLSRDQEGVRGALGLSGRSSDSPVVRTLICLLGVHQLGQGMLFLGEDRGIGVCTGVRMIDPKEVRSLGIMLRA